MPIYEYECTSCHHHFDLMQKITDEPEKQCPACNNNTLAKLVSAAGFQLKGTGWYATDFKTKNNESTETKVKSGDSHPIEKTKEATSPSKTQAGDTK